MKRRDFLKIAAFTAIGVSLPSLALSDNTLDPVTDYEQLRAFLPKIHRICMQPSTAFHSFSQISKKDGSVILEDVKLSCSASDMLILWDMEKLNQLPSITDDIPAWHPFYSELGTLLMEGLKHPHTVLKYLNAEFKPVPQIMYLTMSLVFPREMCGTFLL